MKKYIKNNGGMALPMVLVIMTILSILATGLAVYAYNSYISVRWMSDQKKAYYFARAGVESTAYAYQSLVSGERNTDLSRWGSMTPADRLLTVSTLSDESITTNRVYIYITKENDQDGSIYNNLAFKTHANETDAIADVASGAYLGYFQVEIADGQDLVTVGSTADNAKEQAVDVKVFKSTAVCGEHSQTTYAYIIPPDTASSMVLYDENGYLSRKGTDEGGQFLKETINVSVDQNGLNVPVRPNLSGNIFQRIYNRIKALATNIRNQFILGLVERFFGTNFSIDMFVKTGEGNIILQKPEKSKYIKANENQHNFYVFATTGDLFLRNCGVDATPSKGFYNSIGLYGDEIVIDEDIKMEVYITKLNGFASGKDITGQVNALIGMIGKRFRLGTVVLGDASTMGPSRYDPVDPEDGGLCYKGAKVPANKVYFNGNVYLKIYTQGGSTETYRVFNAGDIAYFYGGNSTKVDSDQTTDADDAEVTGIDLLKYFTDAVIMGKDGHIYGSEMIEKMKKINETYYGNADAYYFGDDTVLLRKIKVEYGADGTVKVDGGKGSVMDIIQPSTTGSGNIMWGRPKGGDRFQEGWTPANTNNGQ